MSDDAAHLVFTVESLRSDIKRKIVNTVAIVSFIYYFEISFLRSIPISTLSTDIIYQCLIYYTLQL